MSFAKAIRKGLSLCVLTGLSLMFLISLTPIPPKDSIPLDHQATREAYDGSRTFTKNVTLILSAIKENEISDLRYQGSKVVTMAHARGRLGNQLFQLASLIGIGLSHNNVPAVSVDDFKDVFNVFEEPDGQVLPFSEDNENTFKEPDADLFEERDIAQFTEVTPKFSYRNWTIDGYFQSYKHFEQFSKQIRQFFTFKQDLINSAKLFLYDNRVSGSVVIGIHVRRGDFLSEYHTYLGRTTVDADYIQRAMEFYEDWYDSITFIVFSDDITWCKENINDKGNAILFSPFSNPGNDLALMSLCDHMIMSIGTFGWWGSWLAGGHVVYYGGYPRPGSEMDKYFNKQDFYPPKWTMIG